MNKIYYYPSALTSPNFHVLIDELLEDLDSDDISKKKLIKCGGAIKYCESNPIGSKFICKKCIANFDLTIKKHDIENKGVEIVNLNDYKINNFRNKKLTSYNFDDIKKIQYKNLNIGYGIISSFVSRVRKVQVNSIFEKKVVNNYYQGALNLVEYFLLFNSKYSIDKIVIYNGRLHTIRPILSYIESNKTSSKILEVVGGRDGTNFRKQKYLNTTPFNRKDFSEYIKENWNLNTLVNQNKLSKNFFEFKRKGIPVFDKSYLIESKNELKLNKNKKIISIFNSSPDERASLGKDWDWNFNGLTDHCDITKVILQNFNSEDYYFVFRMHPNLVNYKGDLENRLKKLEYSYSNFKLISPSEKINSYELLDASDYILSFGSSIGVEATYWRKISIVIGKSFYDYLDVAYNSKNIDTLKKIILGNCNPKPIYDSLKWALFYTNRIYNVYDFHKHSPLNVYGGILNKILVLNDPKLGFKIGVNNIYSRIILKSILFFKNKKFE